MQETRYFSHAWALLTKDKGWPKVIVMLALWMLIPIVGWLWVLGYEAEWARLIAWGVEGSPKQKNIDLGQCLTSGWRVFVVQFGWSILWMILSNFILLGSGSLQFYNHYPYVDTDFGSFTSLILDIAGIFCWIFLVIAGVRTAIYQRYTAGYQLNRIFDMLKRDIRGFVKIVGISLLAALISGAVIGVLCFFAVVLGALGLGLLSYGVTSGTNYSVPMFFILLATVLFFLIVEMILLVLSLINYVMVGLWLRQFDVLSWGASEDPLPESPLPGQEATPVQPGQAQVPQPGGQGQPQKPGWTQDSQGVFTANAPTSPADPMAFRADLGQNGFAPTPLMPAGPGSTAAPYPSVVPSASSAVMPAPAAAPAPATDAPVSPFPSSGPVNVTHLSGAGSSSSWGQTNELASPVESVSLDGSDLTQQVSQTADGKMFQTPEGFQTDGGAQAGAQAMGQESPSSEASEKTGGNDPAPGQM